MYRSKSFNIVIAVLMFVFALTFQLHAAEEKTDAEKTDKEKKMFSMSFSRNHANDFMNYMYVGRNVSERRYNGMLTFGKMLFNWMLSYGYVKSNPFEIIKRKKEKT